MASFALLLIGCAAVPPRATESHHEADDGWLEHVGALIMRVRAPQRYLTVLNAFPFFLHIDLLEHTHSTWQHAETYRPIQADLGSETVWAGALNLTSFLNTERFVRDGYLAIRPTGTTRVPNPLRARCPSDLVEAATCDLHGRNVRILDTRPTRRDEHHGCIYRFRYIID